jgi:uncharacterized protein YciI
MAEPWKFFIIEITYLLDAERINQITPDHRAFLKTGYEKGWLLLSGPQVPRTGGMIVAKAPSREAIEEFVAQDPYRKNQAADYRIIEINPVLRSEIVEDWITQS